MEDIKCPYCKAAHDLDPEYAYGIAEDEHYEYECGDCEKTFVITHTINHYWDTQCSDSGHNLIPNERHEGWGNCTHCDEFIKIKHPTPTK